MEKKYELIILPEAQQDIRDIILYIANHLCAPQAALNLQSDFEEAINSLSYKPERIRLVDDQPWRDKGIRKIRVKNYYIYFIILDSTVNIMAVIYIGRDQSPQLQLHNT